ncbi:hypothetical protein HYDPIDRAFT_43874 [Hydnomerulius pinastri MD-312]|uniref:Protein kinase domain-containing protein n=1 Tax=Hydnomerulius pinastri MD-312 TaxID=994086 RepID=A0A0C9VPY7_9AGAM|nr:hypothetical protein HYDPIDRAFT_43874 [Hydnomerulius pinastri MD-312]
MAAVLGHHKNIRVIGVVVASLINPDPAVEASYEQSKTTQTHFRVACDVPGRKLETFRSTRELVSGILYAIEGELPRITGTAPTELTTCVASHWRVYESARVLHRNINASNIFLTEDGGGYLVDWDLCEETISKMHAHGGTWEFMSAALLQNPRKLNDFQDDLESFLHVLAWMTVRYVPSSLKSNDREAHLKFMYDESQEGEEGCKVGGWRKSQAFEDDTHQWSDPVYKGLVSNKKSTSEKPLQ